MDWTSRIGRTRPVELDALRFLVLVHRLGREPQDGDRHVQRNSNDEDVVRELQGERRAQHLDHLLAHPATLAYLLMDVYLQGENKLADQRGAIARRTRWLLANERRRYDPARRSRSRRRGQDSSVRVDSARMHRFRPFTWRRWDDSLAALHGRGLLRVRVDDSPARGTEALRYGLTSRGSRWLDDNLYPNHDDAGFHAQVCTVISDYLPVFLSEDHSASDRLSQAENRLADFRRDQSLTAADDLAPPRFHAAFREKL